MQKILAFLAVVFISLWVFPVAARPAGTETAVRVPLDQPAPPALAASIRSVIQRHPQLQAARATLAASQAQLRAADKALYNPELEFDAERSDINKGYIQLGQTLDLGNQRGARTRVAETRLAGARAEYTLAVQGLARDLLKALAAEQTARERARLADRGLQLMQQFAAIAEQRHRAGDLSQVELDLARLAYNEALMTHAQALAEAATAQQELRARFVHLPDRLPDLPETLPKPELPQDRETFLRNLPIMRSLEAQVAAARHTVSLRRAERSWDPTIAIRGGREAEQSLIGATLTLPLNIRNTFQAEVDVAQQDLIASEQAAQLAFRTRRATVLASTERFRLLKQAWGNWSKGGRISVNRQLQLIERLWRAGDMSTAEYLIQLKQALETRSAGLELRGQLWESGFDWLYETASIDRWLNITISEQE
ncbi:MAG TPA: TolC family protein [Chromatiales bacterium]|nr:TolC family protein [Chromatiales bacterium]